MKLMIASDLHGSDYYVEQLCQRFAAEKPERLVLLGDLLYHGPRNALPLRYDTARCAERLNALSPPPIAIRGNCDGEVDQLVLSFPMLSENAVLFADGYSLFLTHGHHLDEARRVLERGDTLLYGHTHLPDFTCTDGLTFVNPGSVSIPKEDSAHSYLIFDGGALFWKDVETGAVLREEHL